jgi:hypothetical protein
VVAVLFARLKFWSVVRSRQAVARA